jgi:hypothetical protein
LLLQEVLGLPLVPPAAAAAVPMVVSLVQCLLLQEVLGLPLVPPAYDVWRLGCIMVDLATAVPLFCVKE